MMVTQSERTWIVEVKANATAEQAVRQALVRGYAALEESWGRYVTVLGINVDTRRRCMTEVSQWELGSFDPHRQCWDHEPFNTPLTQIDVGSLDNVRHVDWPFPYPLDTGHFPAVHSVEASP